MLRGKPVTAIIPVRGGSKGIPGKNLTRVGRDTLLERSIKQALLCRYVDRVLVTTDHPEMYTIAQQYSVATKVPRPAALASDDAKTIDVILHTLEENAVAEGYVMLVQVTSPLRTLGDMNAACEQFEASDAAAIVSLVRFDAPHPDKIQKIENGEVKSYLGKESMVARQSLPEVYALNGALYITSTEVLRSKRSFMPSHTMPYVMPEERSINLDTPTDMLLLQTMLEKGMIDLEEYDDVPPAA